MEREEIKKAMDLLVARVRLEEDGRISFDRPDRDGMVGLGMTAELADRIAGAPWFDEMVTDVVETPEFCEPGAGRDEVLGFAQDVVREYIRKRL
ncbi:MAG: hypothetical protein ACYTAF_15175 [Planctomycetota bacterium]|jgi:hypothetical protein